MEVWLIELFMYILHGKKTDLEHVVTNCTGHASAKTRPHQLYMGYKESLVANIHKYHAELNEILLT